MRQPGGRSRSGSSADRQGNFDKGLKPWEPQLPCLVSGEILNAVASTCPRTSITLIYDHHPSPPLHPSHPKEAIDTPALE